MPMANVIILQTTKPIQMKSLRSPLDAADFHMRGVTSPNLDPPNVLSARRRKEKNSKHFPRNNNFIQINFKDKYIIIMDSL